MGCFNDSIFILLADSEKVGLCRVLPNPYTPTIWNALLATACFDWQELYEQKQVIAHDAPRPLNISAHFES